eukprot:ANDGO_02883.mRNA.1 hypothetical protein
MLVCEFLGKSKSDPFDFDCRIYRRPQNSELRVANGELKLRITFHTLFQLTGGSSRPAADVLRDYEHKLSSVMKMMCRHLFQRNVVSSQDAVFTEPQCSFSACCRTCAVEVTLHHKGIVSSATDLIVSGRGPSVETLYAMKRHLIAVEDGAESGDARVFAIRVLHEAFRDMVQSGYALRFLGMQWNLPRNAWKQQGGALSSSAVWDFMRLLPALESFEIASSFVCFRSTTIQENASLRSIFFPDVWSVETAAPIHVSSADELDKALQISCAGDVILLNPGTYEVNISIQQKDLILRGCGLRTEDVVLRVRDAQRPLLSIEECQVVVESIAFIQSTKSECVLKTRNCGTVFCVGSIFHSTDVDAVFDVVDPTSIAATWSSVINEKMQPVEPPNTLTELDVAQLSMVFSKLQNASRATSPLPAKSSPLGSNLQPCQPLEKHTLHSTLADMHVYGHATVDESVRNVSEKDHESTAPAPLADVPVLASTKHDVPQCFMSLESVWNPSAPNTAASVTIATGPKVMCALDGNLFRVCTTFANPSPALSLDYGLETLQCLVETLCFYLFGDRQFQVRVQFTDSGDLLLDVAFLQTPSVPLFDVISDSMIHRCASVTLLRAVCDVLSESSTSAKSLLQVSWESLGGLFRKLPVLLQAEDVFERSASDFLDASSDLGECFYNLHFLLAFVKGCEIQTHFGVLKFSTQKPIPVWQLLASQSTGFKHGLPCVPGYELGGRCIRVDPASFPRENQQEWFGAFGDGDVLLFSTGVYDLNEVIEIKKSLRICGSDLFSQDATFRTSNTGGFFSFSLPGDHRARIERVSFQYDYANASAPFFRSFSGNVSFLLCRYSRQDEDPGLVLCQNGARMGKVLPNARLVQTDSTMKSFGVFGSADSEKEAVVQALTGRSSTANEKFAASSLLYQNHLCFFSCYSLDNTADFCPKTFDVVLYVVDLENILSEDFNRVVSDFKATSRFGKSSCLVFSRCEQVPFSSPSWKVARQMSEATAASFLVCSSRLLVNINALRSSLIPLRGGSVRPPAKSDIQYVLVSCMDSAFASAFVHDAMESSPYKNSCAKQFRFVLAKDLPRNCEPLLAIMLMQGMGNIADVQSFVEVAMAEGLASFRDFCCPRMLLSCQSEYAVANYATLKDLAVRSQCQYVSEIHCISSEWGFETLCSAILKRIVAPFAQSSSASKADIGPAVWPSSVSLLEGPTVTRVPVWKRGGMTGKSWQERIFEFDLSNNRILNFRETSGGVFTPRNTVILEPGCYVYMSPKDIDEPDVPRFPFSLKNGNRIYYLATYNEELRLRFMHVVQDYSDGYRS